MIGDNKSADSRGLLSMRRAKRMPDTPVPVSFQPNGQDPGLNGSTGPILGDRSLQMHSSLG